MRELNGIFVQAWYLEEPEALENAEGNEDEEDGLFFGLLFDIETLSAERPGGLSKELEEYAEDDEADGDELPLEDSLPL